MRNAPCPLSAILEQVSESKKYRSIAPQVVARIATHEWSLSRNNLKTTLKETKNALHQVAGAYFRASPRYETWRTALENGEKESVLPEILASHASVAERDLESLPAFYSQIFAHLNAPKTVLDLACGLHPIAFAHYAPAAPSVTYYAADIYTDLAAFLNTAFPLLEIQGRAFTADLLAEEVSTTLLEEVGEVDVVLLFKILPLLDLWDKSASARLLDGLPTKQIVVTYPTQSLGGNRCGMSRNYTQRFTELTANTGWQITPLEFPKEIGFVITK